MLVILVMLVMLAVDPRREEGDSLPRRTPGSLCACLTSRAMRALFTSAGLCCAWAVLELCFVVLCCVLLSFVVPGCVGLPCFVGQLLEP